MGEISINYKIEAMKKFIALYYAPASAMEQMSNLSPEEQSKGMEAWFAWKDKCGAAIVDFGAPLMDGEQESPEGKWTAGNKEVTGYSIVQAKDLAAAKLLFKDHCHLTWAPGCSIGLHEFAPI